MRDIFSSRSDKNTQPALLCFRYLLDSSFCSGIRAIDSRARERRGNHKLCCSPFDPRHACSSPRSARHKPFEPGEVFDAVSNNFAIRPRVPRATFWISHSLPAWKRSPCGSERGFFPAVQESLGSLSNPAPAFHIRSIDLCGWHSRFWRLASRNGPLAPELLDRPCVRVLPDFLGSQYRKLSDCLVYSLLANANAGSDRSLRSPATVAIGGVVRGPSPRPAALFNTCSGSSLQPGAIPFFSAHLFLLCCSSCDPWGSSRPAGISVHPTTFARHSAYRFFLFAVLR